MEDRNKKLYFKKRIRNTQQSDIHIQFSRIVIEFFYENMIFVKKFWFLCTEVERAVVVPDIR